jgi:hypothetical protein
MPPLSPERVGEIMRKIWGIIPLTKSGQDIDMEQRDRTAAIDDAALSRGVDVALDVFSGTDWIPMREGVRLIVQAVLGEPIPNAQDSQNSVHTVALLPPGALLKTHPLGSTENPVRGLPSGPEGSRWLIVGGYRSDGTPYTLPEKDREAFVVRSGRLVPETSDGKSGLTLGSCNVSAEVPSPSSTS